MLMEEYKEKVRKRENGMKTRLNRKVRKKGGVKDEGEENGVEKGCLDKEENDIKDFFRIT
jgi:hypothetical protein